MTAEFKHRLNAGILTVVIHALLILLLLYFALTPLDPPLTGGEGMVVNLGYVDEATGDVQPMSDVTDLNPQPTPVTPTPVTDQTEDVVTQSDEKTVDINKTENRTDNVTPTVTETTPRTETQPKTEPEKTVNKAALYKGKPNNSTSQGTSDKGEGDQGSRSGDPNSDYYGAPGTGTSPGHGGMGGPSAKLAGRVPRELPSPEYKVQEEGRVIVEITVDKYGNVVNAKPGVKGSTTTNTYLLDRAKKAAMSSKFNPDVNGAEIQIGTIVYNFQLK